MKPKYSVFEVDTPGKYMHVYSRAERQEVIDDYGDFEVDEYKKAEGVWIIPEQRDKPHHNKQYGDPSVLVIRVD